MKRRRDAAWAPALLFLSPLVSLVSLASLASNAAGCTRPVDLVATAGDAGEGGSKDAPTLETSATPETGTTPHNGCATPASVTLITAEAEVLSFNPDNDKVTSLGFIKCPDFVPPVASAVAVTDDGTIFLLAQNALIAMLAFGTAGTSGAIDCKPWAKSETPPTATGAGLALVGSKDPAFFFGVDAQLYRTSATASFAAWSPVGTLDPADHVRALMGTGDGRLWAVLEPSEKTAYRIATIDPVKGVLGVKTTIPPPFNDDPLSDGAFALWGGTLFVFTQKGFERYDFATGVLGAPQIVPFGAPLVAAAAPPCASTL